MQNNMAAGLEELARHLAGRHEQILEAWRIDSQSDPQQATAGSLTHSQFNDHIPEVLAAFEHKLGSQPGSPGAARATRELQEEEVKHGQQRWQQGYRLQELMREWGYLHLCLARELENFAAERPNWDRRALAMAQRKLIHLINDGIRESADQYARMERSEAAGRVKDLELAVAQLREFERRRAKLIHQAVHDLRGDVQSVGNVAELLGSPEIAGPERTEFSSMLQAGVSAVSSMLGDLMDLARLEAGQEQRNVADFDAAALLGEFCRLSLPRATARQLYLHADGPATLRVEGDAHKVRRLVQNLVLNALKYTEKGGVTVSWGREESEWWLMVKDTGPGLQGGPAAPLASQLRDATITARESEVRAATREGRESHMLDQAEAGSTELVPSHAHPGEGIGLSIVKRLCELLDASLELVSSGESGTTLRVLFPLSYSRAKEK
jgi:signal transduction histidine kinase